MKFLDKDFKISDVSDIDVSEWAPEVILGRLTCIKRFIGRGLTVWDHSVMVANRLPPELYGQGLLHDAHEMIIGDIPAPIVEVSPVIQFLEDLLQEQVYRAYGIGLEFMTGKDKVRKADKDVGQEELRVLQGQGTGSISLTLHIRAFTWLEENYRYAR